MTDNDTTPGTTAAGESSTTPPPPTTQPIFPATPPAAPAPPAVAAPPAVPPPASSSPAAPPPPPSGDPVATPKPKRRVLTWVVRSVVTLVMLGLIGVSAYLVVVSQQWSERVDELTAVSKDLGAEVANERSAKEGALAAAEEIQGQLDTLKARVTELANEEANVRDREEALIELLDSMTNCADERAKLIDGYGSRWENSETGAVLTTRQYAAQITEYCTTVQSSIDEFLAEAD